MYTLLVPIALYLLANLDNVFIFKYMVFSAALGLVFCRSSPYKGMRELVDEVPMQTITEFFDCRVALTVKNDGFVVVGYLTFWLCIDAQHITSVPVTQRRRSK